MLKPERVAAFCDGVIAIAITLLVLGLEVPSVHEVPEKELGEFLIESLQPLHGFIVSFLLVGTYWVQHYVIFHYIERIDRPFLCLNGLFLLCVSFVPFPTGLQVTYTGDELAMIIYAVTQAACGLSLLAIWTYAASKHRLIDQGISPVVIKSMKRRIWITPLVSVLAIACSFISLSLSRALFLAIPIAYLSHRLIDHGWLPEQREGGSSKATS